MRRGIVTAANPIRAMVAIATEDGGHTIVELLSDWELKRGDIISWNNDYELGHETYHNQTRGTRSEVYVQNHGVSTADLPAQLLL